MRFAVLQRSAFRCLAAVAVACLSIGVPSTPVAAATDSGVTTAEQRLQTAQERAHSLSYALDEVAETYERANAHQQRLRNELEAVDADVAVATAAVVTAEEQLAQRVTAAYKRPGADNALTDAVLLAPDAGSALHRAALFSHMVSNSAAELDHVEWAAALTTTDARQGYVVAAGAEASIQQWRARARELTAALDDAQREVLAAEDGVVAARKQAAERAEAARIAAAAVPRDGRQYDSGSAMPPRVVDGKTCPIGTPNGFIDSWGFPRSGGRGHEGVDMFAPYGTPLYAVADGYIYRVYTNPLGGLAINLIDDDGNMYYYAHLSADYVEDGQKVEVGQVIGAVGDSGNARGTPPHLHWQFHPGNGSPVNPYPLAYALCRG